MMFISGVAQLFVFASINTYCVDVFQSRSAEVIGTNYALRFVISSVGTATVIPMIDAIGIGWTSTISAFLLWIGWGLILVLLRYGEYLRIYSRYAQWLNKKILVSSELEAATRMVEEKNNDRTVEP
jgi:hypothetical protein